MFKEFALKKMLKAKVGDQIPEEDLDKLIKVVNENPELFQKIGNEIQAKVKNEGKDQQAATMEVMQNYKDEIQKIYSQSS